MNYHEYLLINYQSVCVLWWAIQQAYQSEDQSQLLFPNMSSEHQSQLLFPNMSSEHQSQLLFSNMSSHMEVYRNNAEQCAATCSTSRFNWRD